MPHLALDAPALARWGDSWNLHKRFSKKEGIDFGKEFDRAFGASLAQMLGGIKVVTPSSVDLSASEPDCVEVGPVRIVGGIRPQNFDAAYRPDGPRVVYD